MERGDLPVPASFTGGCVCGAVRYESSEAAIAMVNCHCRDCQRAGGSAYSPTVVVRATALRFTASEPRYYGVTAESGGAVRRAFCGTCGAPILATTSGRPDFVGIRAGSLDDPSWFRPTADVWTANAQPWDVMNARLERFPRSRPRK